MFNKFCECFLNVLIAVSARCNFFFKAHCIHPGCLLSADFIHQTFYFFVIRFFWEIVQLRCQPRGMFYYQPGKGDTWDARYTNILCLKLFKYKADTFEMIQNALEDNNMDKAIVYKQTKREKVIWRVLAEQEMSEQKKSTKNPQTVDKIESF